MPIIRLAFLLAVLGALALLLSQNWSPALPLVFLGVKTQALPLALWILSSVAAGALTALAISSLFTLSNYFAATARQQRQSQAASQSFSSQQSQADYQASNYSQASSTADQVVDDWSSGDQDSDWDFAEEPQKSQDSNQDAVRDSTNYEVGNAPKSSYNSGSVYSYGYREPSNSGVGKTESIYDANYRVITPPAQQTDKPKEDEDWGFEDEDDSPKP